MVGVVGAGEPTVGDEEVRYHAEKAGLDLEVLRTHPLDRANLVAVAGVDVTSDVKERAFVHPLPSAYDWLIVGQDDVQVRGQSHG